MKTNIHTERIQAALLFAVVSCNPEHLASQCPYPPRKQDICHGHLPIRRKMPQTSKEQLALKVQQI